MENDCECIIVGGGAAGLAAAITLGRARRRTLLVDGGAQSNLPAHAIGGLLGHDRRPPAQLYAEGRAELSEYPSVEILDGAVTALSPVGERFTAALSGDGTVAARRVLLAGGMDYRYPDVPGLAERWGESAFHCPFCHGWEVRGRSLAVLSSGAAGVHQALLLRAWSDAVTLLCGPEGVEAEDREQLTAAGIAIDERPAVALHGPGRALEAIELEEGAELACGGVLVATTLHQRSALAADLGVAFARSNPMSDDAIELAPMRAETSVAGVYAAGDVVSGMPSVSRAIAAGHMAGAMLVMDLVSS